MTEINIISYNVKGLGHPIKRKKILSQLKSFKCSVALLQETHLNELEHKKLKREWIDQVFFASCPKSRKRGVAILFHRNTFFYITMFISSLFGRECLFHDIYALLSHDLFDSYD
uniref:Endonuclease/exonuclease/phosphatase domain-containing protein n=1 Tax=Neogobius melanostomus TaxID=47308 RepID=A0A8C6T7R8_9GOBI